KDQGDSEPDPITIDTAADGDTRTLRHRRTPGCGEMRLPIVAKVKLRIMRVSARKQSRTIRDVRLLKLRFLFESGTPFERSADADQFGMPCDPVAEHSQIVEHRFGVLQQNS